MAQQQAAETTAKSSWRHYVTPAAVDRVFTRLAARYGSRFTAQWSDAELNKAARQEWFGMLKGYRNEDLARALDNWRQAWPPNAAEFAVACRQVASHKEFKLETRKVCSHEEAKRNIDKLKMIINQTGVIHDDDQPDRENTQAPEARL